MRVLSDLQRDVLVRMRATGEPLVRCSGGYWTFPSIAKAAGYRPNPDQLNSWRGGTGDPAWDCGVQTLRALERRGLVSRAANTWHDPWSLTDAGRGAL